MHVEVPNEDGPAWTEIENRAEVEIHLIDRNVEQFSHAGTTPFGYTTLGKELGRTRNSGMAENILNSILDHECMEKEAIHAIVRQLKMQPTIQGILELIVTTHISNHISNAF
jgi:lipopolysaccharide biosynthesis regulator YciM